MSSANHQGSASGGQNFFHQENFFTFDLQAGTMQTRAGFRAFLADGSLLAGLQQALERLPGEVSAPILYATGRHWGRHEMTAFVPLLENACQRKLPEMGAAFFLEQWWEPLRLAGWGCWHLEMEWRRQGMIFIDLRQSATVAAHTLNDRSSCHLYAGLYAGVFSFLTNMDLSGLELECAATGSEFCKFMVGTENRIRAAELLLREGAAAATILERLSQ